jgi:hypothetical protein
MKALIILSMLTLTGCIGTSVSANGVDSRGNPWNAKVSRIAVGQKNDIPKLEVPGLFAMEGYSTDGGAEMMKLMISAAMELGKKSVTP